MKFLLLSGDHSNLFISLNCCYENRTTNFTKLSFNINESKWFMNQKILLTGILCLTLSSVQVLAQTKKEKIVHPLIQDITNRNELSINVAPVVTMFMGDHNLPKNLCFSIGYNRNFGRNHYLRTGIKIVTESLPTAGNDHSVNTFYNSITYDTSSTQQLSSFNDVATVGYSNHFSMKTSINIGYEHLFGRRRTRFLLGIDALAGFSYQTANGFLTDYQVTYTLDSTGRYNANVLGSSDRYKQVTSINFHFGFSPRIGLRYEVSKRIAFTAVYCPIFYFQTSGYAYSGDTHMFEKYDGFRMSSFVQPAIAEVGVVVKL